MPTCAMQKKITQASPIYNLILPIPDTDFREFLQEVDELPRYAPGIIKAIEKDLTANARAKKKLRIEDRKCFENLTSDLPEFHVVEAELLADKLEIGIGRPRRGKIGSPLKSEDPQSHPQSLDRPCRPNS